MVREKQRGDEPLIFNFLLYRSANDKDKVEANASYWEQLKDGAEVQVSGYRDSEGVIHAEEIQIIRPPEIPARKATLRILLGVAAFSFGVTVIGFLLETQNNWVANYMSYVFIVALVAWIITPFVWQD